ncbi:MAG: esterase-like activity of phytase family protein [Pseudomonadota bacterium]
MTRLSAGLVASALALATAFPVQADSFNRIASFNVADNLPQGTDRATETSAEIIAATDDGMTLVYTDSPLGVIGMIDITDPANPQARGTVALDGEPTAVSIIGPHAFVGVNTSESFTEPSGHLAVIDIASGAEGARCDLGGQPDSVAAAPDGSFIAIAIENERDEDLGDGVIPQLPAGNVTIFPVTDAVPNCDGMIVADLTGLADVAPSDPEPEFVDVNAAGEIVVSLQENNHMVVISGTTGEVLSHFSAGDVTLTGIDLEEERALIFNQTQADRVREPDAVKWFDTDHFVTANEGDYEGGSRGWTIFHKDGSVVHEEGTAFEYAVISIGHYPERRSGNKGVEPESIEVATFGETPMIFVGAERSSVVGVYDASSPASPELVGLLPSGIGPEGIVALPGRNLLVTANEVDLIEDNGPRAHVMIYALQDADPIYPTLVSDRLDNGRPVGFGALSGLVADAEEPGILYAVNDSFYGMQPTIFVIDANQTPARITATIPVTRGLGAPAQKLDMEGITLDGEGGFFIASEGRTDRLIPHAIYHVNGDGSIEEEIPFPSELLAVERRFGAEGITKVGNTLWIAIQRSWADDPKNTVKLVAYDIETGEWGAVAYPTEAPETGWIGLSEITAHDGRLFIIERDNQIGDRAKVKKLYSVSLDGLEPASLGADLPLVEKTLEHDFMADLASFNGYVVDKIEGFAIDAAGTRYAVTDNDGVDDSSGETLFFVVE